MLRVAWHELGGERIDAMHKGCQGPLYSILVNCCDGLDMAVSWGCRSLTGALHVPRHRSKHEFTWIWPWNRQDNQVNVLKNSSKISEFESMYISVKLSSKFFYSWPSCRIIWSTDTSYLMKTSFAISRLQTWFGLEVDHDVEESCRSSRRSGCIILRGIQFDAEIGTE